MKLTFDYYHNLEKVNLDLYNPDGRELFPLSTTDKKLTLRFNDLSELSFRTDSTTTLSDGTQVELEAYEYVQAKRLVRLENVGWFQISEIEEVSNGKIKYKKVTAKSYQAVLRDRGFLSEERVYCFYNQNDPFDTRYDSSNEASIPSVLGQLYKQLGINQNLEQGRDEPETPYQDWTVTYINPALIYTGNGERCRTFKENVTNGYDWIINDVEEAFGIVVLFDFMYKTIHVLSPEEITERVNIIYTFNNFMREISIDEDSEDIVTVLNCSGDNCDITAVNPTGTNYICDFSYFMDKINYRWMSPSLISKIEEWEAECDANKDIYTDYILQLRELYVQDTKYKTDLQSNSMFLQDLKNAQAKRSVVGSGTAGDHCGTVSVETVGRDETSITSHSDYYSTPFDGDSEITAYKSPPTYDPNTSKWSFSGDSKTGTADEIVEFNLSDSNSSADNYWYFYDTSNKSSYCKLTSSATVNSEAITASYYCSGFDRYIAFTYPSTDASTGKVTYTDTLQDWINLREKVCDSLNKKIYGYSYETETPTSSSIYGRIKAVSAQLNDISSKLNILSYFSKTPELLRELNYYWIEGDYTNDNIAVLETTTLAESIDLSNELIEAGKMELSKVSQPRYSFTIDSIDATKQYEFKSQMELLELGKIITIEKEEGVWYYPALLEIAINLDNEEDFGLSFANATRLDDWGFTYGDLVATSSATSRQVSANWQNLLAYSKDRQNISSIIKDPLNATLRAAFANMSNQEFIVDNTGILGRKKISETSSDFEDEQVRLINNVLMFTDDNWQTSKTALGKISYTDENKKQVVSYGLIAETIIGSLIMGNSLKIRNNDNSVTINESGITIKSTMENDQGEEEEVVVFKASSNGELIVRNYATVESVASAIDLANNGINAYVKSINSNISSFGWSLTSTGFYLYSAFDSVVRVTEDGLYVKGKISAKSGDIGGFTIGSSLYTGDMTSFTTGDTTQEGIYIGKEGIQMRAVTDDGKIGRFWVNEYGRMSLQMGEPGTGYFLSFDFDGLHVHNGLDITEVGCESLGLQSDKIQIYTMTDSGSPVSVIPILFRAQTNDYYLSGNWYLNNSSIATTSWRGAKDEIETLPSKYEVLFDNLKPVRFKYIHGDSGRYHTGFILDELKDAIDAAGLDTNEVGAYCVNDSSTGEGGIRYEELIAICVKKIKTLENEINILKNKLEE